MNSTDNLSYDVFINAPPPQDGDLPNGEPKRPVRWDKVYADIPPTPVTAVTVPDDRFTLEGYAP